MSRNPKQGRLNKSEMLGDGMKWKFSSREEWHGAKINPKQLRSLNGPFRWHLFVFLFLSLAGSFFFFSIGTNSQDSVKEKRTT